MHQNDSALALRQEPPAERKQRLARERQQRRRQKLAQKGLTTRGTAPIPAAPKPVCGCVICGQPISQRQARKAYCSSGCRVEASRIRQRFPGITTYQQLRDKSFELKEERAAQRQLGELQRQGEEGLGFWARFHAETQRRRHDASHSRAKYKGAGWTLELEAEFWRWCDWRTRYFRYYRAQPLPGGRPPDPEDRSISSYDACSDDYRLEQIRRAHRQHIWAANQHWMDPEELAAEVEACVPSWAIADFWKPRIWRDHPYRAQVDQEAWPELYPHGKPAIADFLEKARQKLEAERFDPRLVFDELMAEPQPLALPPAQATALPTLRLEDHPALAGVRAGAER